MAPAMRQHLCARFEFGEKQMFMRQLTKFVTAMLDRVRTEFVPLASLLTSFQALLQSGVPLDLRKRLVPAVVDGG